MTLITFNGVEYETDITYLNCDDETYISEIPYQFVNLRKLTCRNTKVTEIPSTLVNLRILDCSDSKVTKIPSTLINLTILHCSNSIVTEIPSTLVNLVELKIENTKITEIPSTLVNLTVLYCSNSIAEIPSTLVNLTVLDCSDSKVTKIPSTLTNLEKLNCMSTRIKELPNTLVNLNYLKCRKSDIQCVPAEITNNLLNVDNPELYICPDPYTSIKKVSKNKSSKKSKQLTDELAQGFQTSKGCYTEKEGVICNMIDLEDTENHEYLSRDNDNVIFMVSPNNDGRYFAYGYNKKELIYDINTDVFYDCKRNSDGTLGRFDNKSKAYIKINLNNYPILVSSEELLAVIEDSTKKLFLLGDPTEKFLYTASYGVLFGGRDHVSADHCQKGTSKDVYTLYILE